MSASFPLAVGFEDALDTGSPSREWRTFRGEMEEATRALNDANVAVYPVDARGLAPPGGLDVEGRLFPSQPGRLARGVPIYTPTPRNLDVIHLLAERTGGKAFYNTNDIGSAVRAALRDSEVTYTLIVVCGVFSGTGLLRKSFPQARRRGGFVEISALPLPC